MKCAVSVAGPVVPPPGCYVIKATPDLPHPACCNIKTVCPGDQGYDASQADVHVIG